MSKLAGRPERAAPSAPRWTPPIPPVAKTRIPAACAAIIVAETVVAAHPPPASAIGEARPGSLADRPRRRGRQRLEIVVGETHQQPAVADGHGGRDRPGLAHGRLRRPGDLEVLRIGQTVADQGRLERNDRTTGRQRVTDLGGDRQAIGDAARNRPCDKPSGATTLSLMPTRRPMTPADIRHQVVVEELDLSPDGRLAVVARRSVRGDRYVIPPVRDPARGASGREATPADLGTRARRAARASPRTAGSVAFIRTRPDRRRRGRLDRRPRPPARSPAHPPPGGHGSVGEIAWSPDGRRLAFTAEVDPPRFLVGPVPPLGARHRAEARRPRSAGAEPSPRARRITRADWRWDGSGHVDRWSHLFVVDARAGARPRQVDGRRLGRGRHLLGTGRADGRLHRRPRPTADTRPRPTIWAVDVDDARGPDASRTSGTSAPRRVLAPAGFANHPVVLAGWALAGGDRRPRGRPARRRQPGRSCIGPADGSAAPWALAPGARSADRQLDGHGPQRLDGVGTARARTGWMPARSSPPSATAVGRIRSASAWTRRPGRPIAPPRPTPRDAPGPWSDATSHTLAVAPTGTIAVLGTLGTRAMELMTLDEDRRRPATLDDALHARLRLAAPLHPAGHAPVRRARGRAARSRPGSPRRRTRATPPCRPWSTSTVDRSARGRRRPTWRSRCSSPGATG